MCGGVSSKAALGGPRPSLPAWCTPGVDVATSGRGNLLCVRGTLLGQHLTFSLQMQVARSQEPFMLVPA